MWSETIGYRDYRHPYLPAFFSEVAATIPLRGDEALLDLGCGAGEVALAFAPFVASLTGMDLEQPMLDEAARRARAIGRDIRLVNARVEDAPLDLGPFRLITIGRAHWFMHAPAALARLDRWLSPGGRILLCLPLQNPDGAEWHRVFSATRERWAKSRQVELMKLTPDQFFAGTDFVLAGRVATRGARPIELEHLIFRALGTPSTTRAMLGADTDRMIADLRATLAPYFRDGPVMEQHVTAGLLYRRRGDG